MAKNKGALTAILLYYFAVHNLSNRCLQNIWFYVTTSVLSNIKFWT